MKIIYLGNWNLGYIVLDKLLQKGVPVSLVVTNYDKNDNDVYKNKVYDLACSCGISVYKTYKDILSLVNKGDIAFSIAYGSEIFKADILDKIKIYNFHPSYLPYYKGAAPIQWQIKNREKEWGMSCHEISVGIDTGSILKRDKYIINEEMVYEKVLDEYNKCFSNFILCNIVEIIRQTELGKEIEITDNDDLKENYKPRLHIPKDMWGCTLSKISEYLNQKRVLFFAGNRAELGIMFPVILEMSRVYYVDLIVSDTYFINGAQDLKEKENFINENKYRINIIKISVSNNNDIYYEALSSIYKKVFNYLRKQDQYQYKYAFALGDRIESLGFALAVFYGQVPLVHMAGGDIANVPYFDTNVRHCVSKIANIHLVFSEESKVILKQLGEEDARICNIGNPSFDYARMKLLFSADQIESEFHIGEQVCIIFTYHSGPLKTALKNLDEYKRCLNGVLDSKAGKIIITYPNHDPGSEEVIKYIDKMRNTDRIIIVKSLGTVKFHSIMNEYQTVIVGNSSSGLLETAYYMCPTLNIGDRQTDRMRGGNVVDVNVNQKEITDVLNQIIENYDDNRKRFTEYRTLYGDGRAAIKALDFLKEYNDVANEELIIKNFVKRI